MTESVAGTEAPVATEDRDAPSRGSGVARSDHTAFPDHAGRTGTGTGTDSGTDRDRGTFATAPGARRSTANEVTDPERGDGDASPDATARRAGAPRVKRGAHVARSGRRRPSAEAVATGGAERMHPEGPALSVARAGAVRTDDDAGAVALHTDDDAGALARRVDGPRSEASHPGAVRAAGRRVAGLVAPRHSEPGAAVAPGRAHVTWRHALAAGLVCFAVWLVLDSPSLLRSAQASPLGTRRSVALSILRPIDDVSRALGLSHVVGAADRALGRTGSGVLHVVGPPPHRPRPTGPANHDTGLTATHRPGPAPPVTVPDGLAPLPAPTAGAPLRLLTLGDSLGLDFGQSFVNDLAATNVVSAVLDGHIDTGLARPDYFDWQAELRADLARYSPQAVVVFIGANDPQNFVEGGTALAYGTPAWNDAYARRVGDFMAAATGAGARMLWVGMPPMAAPGLNAKMQQLNGIYQAEAAAHPGVTYVASWPALSGPQGQFEAFLPDASGNVVEVREPDGTHISPDGAERLSRAVVAAMDHEWGLAL
jgi:lysophospholipase L1-like esterase